MYYSSADFSAWFRLKLKSRKTLDTNASTKFVFIFNTILWEDTAQHLIPPRYSARMHQEVSFIIYNYDCLRAGWVLYGHYILSCNNVFVPRNHQSFIL